jgi:hypothetical protein
MVELGFSNGLEERAFVKSAHFHLGAPGAIVENHANEVASPIKPKHRFGCAHTHNQVYSPGDTGRLPGS